MSGARDAGPAATWINSHTGQLIIVESLILRSWLIGKSMYLIVS